MLHKKIIPQWIDSTNIAEQNNISNKNIKKTQQIIEKELIGKRFFML